MLREARKDDDDAETYCHAYTTTYIRCRRTIFLCRCTLLCEVDDSLIGLRLGKNTVRTVDNEAG